MCVVSLVSHAYQIKKKTRNKSNASFEALQYRQDLFTITHYQNIKTSLAIYVVQKITIIRAQKIGKSAV